ncbi:Endonuclease/exonuclease/phosphatase [Trinorchestia longiramus]|nr:Endonuclease/exonuclease/phosphatase [Trinorchestia longiramus]
MNSFPDMCVFSVSGCVICLMSVSGHRECRTGPLLLFLTYLDNILSFPHEALIMGDLNLPHIYWTNRQSQALGSKPNNLLNTNSLQQDVNEPTRRDNILDLVMTTPDLSINGLEVTDKISDHQMIDFTLEIQDPNAWTQHKQVLDYKRANFELIKEELDIRSP